MKTVPLPMDNDPTGDRLAVAEAVAEQDRYLEELTGPPQRVNATPEAEAPAEARPGIDHGANYVPFPSIPASPVRTEKVELAFVPESDALPAFKLIFNVSGICERPHYISLRITDELGFQPSATMKFDLKFRGKVVPVIFMGAEFEFQSPDVRGISFLVDSKRQQRYDQNRQSGTR